MTGYPAMTRTILSRRWRMTWLTRDDVSSSMSSHLNDDIIALRLLSCFRASDETPLRYPDILCSPILDTDISDTVSFNGMTFYRCLLRVYGIFLSKDICPVYPFTFDYIWLYLIICLSIFFAFATTFLALLCSGVHLLLRGMSHIRCVSRNHSHSEIWDSSFFSSLTLENYIKIEKLIWILFIWK